MRRLSSVSPLSAPLTFLSRSHFRRNRSADPLDTFWQENVSRFHPPKYWFFRDPPLPPLKHPLIRPPQSAAPSLSTSPTRRLASSPSLPPPVARVLSLLRTPPRVSSSLRRICSNRQSSSDWKSVERTRSKNWLRRGSKRSRGRTRCSWSGVSSEWRAVI